MNKSMSYMFHQSAICGLLGRTMNLTSFFDGKYLLMPVEQRKEAFSVAFPWRRRGAFVLFLMHQGYLHCSSSKFDMGRPADTIHKTEVVACDILFDVADMFRYVCVFL